MRIVHVTDTFLPRLGGIERHVADLADRQAACGHDVHVVTGSPGGERWPVTVHRLGLGRWGSAREVARGPAGRGRLLAALAPDVVHSHVSVLSPLAAGFAAAASASGVPAAVTVHSLWPSGGLAPRAVGALLGLRHRPLAWSAVSGAAAGPVRAVLGPRARVAVLPNAVDGDWWRAGPPRLPRPAQVRVVSVMRLAARKRPVPLLRMMAEARAILPVELSLRLVLVGDGPQRRRVERQAARLGMGAWVEMPGRLGRLAVRAALADADLYVAPADLESFGIAALEARAAGLPIVAKSHGGVAEFVADGVEGLLASDDRAMVAALVALAGSPTRRAAIAAHNRSVPPRLAWGVALARTDGLYARAGRLAGRPQPGPRPARLARPDVGAAR